MKNRKQWTSRKCPEWLVASGRQLTNNSVEGHYKAAYGGVTRPQGVIFRNRLQANIVNTAWGKIPPAIAPSRGATLKQKTTLIASWFLFFLWFGYK